MEWDPSIWINELNMVEDCKAKDIVSSKCPSVAKEMKDTWIASL
jgi:hypothetical protein